MRPVALLAVLRRGGRNAKLSLWLLVQLVLHMLELGKAERCTSARKGAQLLQTMLLLVLLLFMLMLVLLLVVVLLLLLKLLLLLNQCEQSGGKRVCHGQRGWTC
jgi:uncharacterized membrane protein